MAGMKEVSSNVAHDLKTPLTRIKARVEAALRSGKARPSTARRWKSTVEESDRLLDTFNALLSIARAEAGQSRSGLEPIDASQIIADVAELYEPMAEEEGGNAASRVAAGPECPGRPPAAGPGPEQSARQCAQIRCTRRARRRRSRSPAQVEGDKVVITVGDHGEGIPPEDRGRVTERFVRLDSSRTQTRQWPGPEPRLRRHEAARRRARAGGQRPRAPRQAGASAAARRPAKPAAMSGAITARLPPPLDARGRAPLPRRPSPDALRDGPRPDLARGHRGWLALSARPDAARSGFCGGSLRCRIPNPCWTRIIAGLRMARGCGPARPTSWRPCAPPRPRPRC